MNKLNEIFSTTFTDALGWTLFHSLWQGAVIAVFLYILLLILKQRRSQTRYAIAVSAHFSILMAATITFIHQFHIITPVTVGESMPWHSLSFISATAIPDPAGDVTSGFTLGNLLEAMQNQMPLFLIAWIAGVIMAICKLTGGYYYIKTKIGKAINHSPDELNQLLSRISSQLDLSKMVRICEVSFIKAPAVFGHLKPVILIPIGLVNHLTPQQVEMVILHELAHIKRNDFLINILQSIVEILFFFNPAVWWISSEIRRERENCCDDLIVKLKGQPAAYIKTLAAVNHFSVSGFKLLPGFFGNDKGQLLKRMQRLVSTKTTGSTVQGYKIVSLLLVLLSFFYYGWMSKPLSVPNYKDKVGFENNMLFSQNAEFPPKLEVLAPTLAVEDTVKDEITKQQEQNAKIKEQERLIKELKAKVNALEQKQNKQKMELEQKLKEKSKEQLKKKLKEKEQLKRQLDKQKNIDTGKIKDLDRILENSMIDELPGFNQFEYFNDEEIVLNIQKNLDVIQEEILENVLDLEISVLQDIELNISGLRDFELVNELELANLEVEIEEAMKDVSKEIEEFTGRFEGFKEELSLSLQEDGIIADKTRRIRISVRDQQVIVNGKKLSPQLSKKYIDLLENNFGEISIEDFDDDRFNFEFDID